jgi:hypothetical protein
MQTQLYVFCNFAGAKLSAVACTFWVGSSLSANRNFLTVSGAYRPKAEIFRARKTRHGAGLILRDSERLRQVSKKT